MRNNVDNIKTLIKGYIELKPNILYYDLCKIFGLSMENLFKLLDIKNYYFNKSAIYVCDNNYNLIYQECSNGHWYRWGYDANGKLNYIEDSYGRWSKYDYDNNGNKVYEENSDGLWYKIEYDKYGNKVYEENSDGYWEKWSYIFFGKILFKRKFQRL